MNKLIGIVISVIVSLSILVVVLSMSEEILYEYTENTIEEEYIAIKDLSSGEVLELSYEYEDLNFVSVEGVNLNLTPDIDIYYFWSDEDTLNLRSAVSDIDDVIIVNYTYLSYGYNEDYSEGTITIVELVPTFIILMIISALAVVSWKAKKA